MIVIATHNGGLVLRDLINDIQSFGIRNNQICVVDNASTDKNHMNFMEDIKYNGINIIFNPISTYEVGAFKLAINKYQSDVWFLFQDSLRIKENIFEYIIPKLTDTNVYTWITFPYKTYDSNDDNIFLQRHYQTTEYSRGMFGSMMMMKNSVAQLVKDDWITPSSKIDSMGMERGVSVVFDKHNIEIIGLEEFNWVKLHQDNQYRFFQKIFKGRK